VVIPDYVANGGANAWWWWTLLGVIDANADQAFEHLSGTMRETVSSLLKLADERGITPRAAADEVSMRNLDRLVEQFGEESASRM
jgi:glutamate dehydrogenase (NAD(P)+)